MKKGIRIYKSGLHFGEEPQITGNQAAGMVSFSGCLLRCSFCYTPETSQYKLGEDYSQEEFLDLLHKLKTTGAKNINLITPSHLWNEIEEPLIQFKKETQNQIPIVLKYGGGEPLRFLQRMVVVGDVFIPDFKISDPKRCLASDLPAYYSTQTLKGLTYLSQSLSNPTYPESAPIPYHSMSHGAILRHLLMPGFEEDSLEVLNHLARIHWKWPVNLMTRYLDPNTGRLHTPSPESLMRIQTHAKDLKLRVLMNGREEASSERERLSATLQIRAAYV